MRSTAVLVAFIALTGPAAALTLVPIPPPARTTWRPTGCRFVPSTNPAFADRTAFRNMHADAWNSAEVSIALAPVLDVDWTVETDKWAPTVTVFDRQGNVYFSPYWPGEPVVLVSLDAATGARRWAIAGSAPSGSAPFVATDPDDPSKDVVYLGLYEEAMAVRTDGTVIWRRPSGLPTPAATGPGGTPPFAFGINYHPAADALVVDTSDGHLYALDRRTGDQLLAAPYSLPGEKAPPANFTHISSPLLDTVNAQLQPLMAGAPTTLGWNELVDVILGGDGEVSNFFSIDPATGRLWVAATAPDAEDGTVDGVSAYGALYGLDLVTAGGPPATLVEGCHVYFNGGSATTPALRPDGTRIYLGDAGTTLHAYDASCHEVWNLDVANQINGAIAVSSDGSELYVSTNQKLLKVIDQGTAGAIAWQATYDMYALGAGESQFHLLLPAIGANGLLAQAGGGLVLPTGVPLPLRLGYAHVDRETGHLRSYVEGPEESVAATSTGPDGGVYLANSPIRRAVAHALFASTTAPLVGGVTKFGPRRMDLFLRDALCAGFDRALNAQRTRKSCPASVAADRRQLTDLLAQSRRTADAAVTRGELTAKLRGKLERRFTLSEARLAQGRLPTGNFGSLCRMLIRQIGS